MEKSVESVDKSFFCSSQWLVESCFPLFLWFCLLKFHLQFLKLFCRSALFARRDIPLVHPMPVPLHSEPVFKKLPHTQHSRRPVHRLLFFSSMETGFHQPGRLPALTQRVWVDSRVSKNSIQPSTGLIGSQYYFLYQGKPLAFAHTRRYTGRRKWKAGRRSRKSAFL